VEKSQSTADLPDYLTHQNLREAFKMFPEKIDQKQLTENLSLHVQGSSYRIRDCQEENHLIHWILKEIKSNRTWKIIASYIVQ
jgi:hypothetical protein